MNTFDPLVSDIKAPAFKMSAVSDKAFKQNLQFRVASPRSCQVSGEKVVLRTESGEPALVINKTGKGNTYLFGFCVQDTYFHTWKEDDRQSGDELMKMVGRVRQNTGVRSHVWSSNPGIEAAIMANSKEGYLFIIKHEESNPETLVKLNGLAFTPKKIIDVDNEQPLDFKISDAGIEIRISASFGTTGLYRIYGK